MAQKPRKKREKLSPKLKSESLPFRRSASTRGPLDIWHATHQKKLSCKQISILDPGASLRSPGLEQELLQNNSSGSEPSPRGAGGTRPRNLGAGGRGAGEGFGGGAAPLRPASERVSERAGVRALRGPAGGRAAAEDAEGRRRGPDSAGAAGRAPPEGVGRPRGRARAEPRALRSVRWLAPSLARSRPPSAAAAAQGGGGGGRAADMAADLNLEWICSLPRSWTYGITRGGRVFFIK